MPEAAGDAALLIPPGDADAAAAAIARIAADPELRSGLVTRGIERVRGRTLEAESARVARFFGRSGRFRPTRLIELPPTGCRIVSASETNGGSTIWG